MIARDVYTALREQFPGCTPRGIEAKLGLGQGSMKRLENDEGIGEKGARILAELNPEKHSGLYAKALKQKKVSRKRKHKKKVVNKDEIVPRKLGLVNPGLLSTYVQELCGYIGRG